MISRPYWMVMMPVSQGSRSACPSSTAGMKRIACQSRRGALPTVQQKQIDRSVAFEKTVKDVSKWSGIIQKNRDAEQLKFPLINQQASANVSSHTMVSTLKRALNLKRKFPGWSKGTASGVKPAAEDTSSELPTNHLNPDQLYKELAKIRSSKFFAEIKSRRQAKIKSKKYRKFLAKSVWKRKPKPFRW